MPDAVGARFVVARKREQAGQHADLPHRARDPAKHAEQLREHRAVLGRPQLFDRVPLQVVAHLVADHRRELRLVLHAQQQPGPHDHHPVRGHRGIEHRHAHNMHAQVRAMVCGQPAGQLGEVLVQRRVVHRQRAAAHARFLAVHHSPQATLIGVHRRAREAGWHLERPGCRGEVFGQGRQARQRRQSGAVAAGGAQEAAARGVGECSHSAGREALQQGVHGFGSGLRLAQVARHALQVVEPDDAAGAQVDQRGVADLFAAERDRSEQGHRHHGRLALVAGVAVADPGEQRVVGAGALAQGPHRIFAQRPIELAVLGGQLRAGAQVMVENTLRHVAVQADDRRRIRRAAPRSAAAPSGPSCALRAFSAASKCFCAASVQSARGSVTPPALIENSSISAGTISSFDGAARAVKPGARWRDASCCLHGAAGQQRSQQDDSGDAADGGHAGLLPLAAHSGRLPPDKEERRGAQLCNRRNDAVCHALVRQRQRPCRAGLARATCQNCGHIERNPHARQGQIHHRHRRRRRHRRRHRAAAGRARRPGHRQRHQRGARARRWSADIMRGRRPGLLLRGRRHQVGRQ